MYKLTTIDIEKIDCPILIRKTENTAGIDGTDSIDNTHSPTGTQEYRFINGAELAASSFEEKYDIKTVRICSGSSGGRQDASGSSGGCDSYIELIVSKPECEQPVSRNKDDSFF